MEYERTYPAIIKGFWMPALPNAHGGIQGGKLAHSVDDPEIMKEFNANLAAFGVTAEYNDKGEIDLSLFEQRLANARSFISEYHRNNISVLLVMAITMSGGVPGAPIPQSVLQNEKFIPQYDRCLEKLVALAEEEKVEYFAPMNEPDFKLGSELADVWSRRVVQIVQKGFTGRIVYKGSLWRDLVRDEKLDFSGYSYVGLSITPRSSDYKDNMEAFRQDVSKWLEKFLKWAREDNFEPMITEFGIWGLAAKLPENQQAEALGIVFEEGKKYGIKGFIVFDKPAGPPRPTDIGGTQIKGTALEQTVKEHFLRLE